MTEHRTIEECRYGDECYRKNPLHFREYSHKHLNEIIKNQQNGLNNQYDIPEKLKGRADLVHEQIESVLKFHPALRKEKIVKQDESDARNRNRSRSPLPGPSRPIQVVPNSVADKLLKAEPYNFFLTAIYSSKPTHRESQSITLAQIFDPSLGEIESSVQINFMVDLEFLLLHYGKFAEKPMLLLYGSGVPEDFKSGQFPSHIKIHKVQMNTPFGTHHTKMMLLNYVDGAMRVIISTANLYSDDWANRTQGLWISPRLPSINENAGQSDGESVTGFRSDLTKYLSHYKLPYLKPYIDRIAKTNFEAVNVFLVASVPGGHLEPPNTKTSEWGHRRLGQLLADHSAPIPDTVPVVAQSSSIGSLGPNISQWIQSQWIVSFKRDPNKTQMRQTPPFKMIYPSINDVLGSHDGILGGGCLPYTSEQHSKQEWLMNYLHRWKSHHRHRSQAMPHIKTYCRWSSEGLYWFLLTSANLSKSAWGNLTKSSIQPSLRINSYEAGVLFIPKFIIGQSTFKMDTDESSTTSDKPFPMPYDVPLTPYASDDSPFFINLIN